MIVTWYPVLFVSQVKERGMSVACAVCGGDENCCVELYHKKKTHTHTHTHKTIIKNKRAIRLYASVGNKYDASCLPVATDDTSVLKCTDNTCHFL